MPLHSSDLLTLSISVHITLLISYSLDFLNSLPLKPQPSTTSPLSFNSSRSPVSSFPSLLPTATPSHALHLPPHTVTHTRPTSSQVHQLAQTSAKAKKKKMDPVVNSTQFCDWRVQSQGNCGGVTYVSFLYTTHIISSFLFLFISVGILIHNIWWKGQKIWEFSRNDRAFRPRPTEGFVFWCTGYFFCKRPHIGWSMVYWDGERAERVNSLFQLPRKKGGEGEWKGRRVVRLFVHC